MSADAQAQSIRVAVASTAEDRRRVFAFRYQACVEEAGRRTVSAADHAQRLLHDALDESATLLYAEADGEMLGTLRRHPGRTDAAARQYREAYRLADFSRFPASEIAFTSRLAISRGARKSQVLGRLLLAGLDHAVDHGVRFDFCHCAPSLVELYEHLGYRRYADNFADPDEGYCVPLVLLVRDVVHLRAVRSPFYAALRERVAETAESAETLAWFNKRFPPQERVPQWMLGDSDFWRFLAAKFYASVETRMPLFEGLTEEEAQELLKCGTILRFHRGERISRAETSPTDMFVVLSGLAQVGASGEGQPIAVYGPGQVIGEVGLIIDCIRTAPVTAVDACEILALDRDRLERLMTNQARLAAKTLFNLCRILAERLVSRTRVSVGK